MVELTASAEGRGHPERTLTLLLVGTSAVFALTGSMVGALALADLSGLPLSGGMSLFPAHPYLQVYGFIAEFVTGVAYSLLPRFKASRLPALRVGYAAYALMTFGNVLFLLPAFAPAGGVAVLAASLLFAAQTIALLARGAGGFREADPLMALSAVSFVMVSALMVAGQDGLLARADVFSPPLLSLSLLGFAGSMIYAIELRSVSFRQCDYRRRAARFSSFFQALAIGSTFLGAAFSSELLSGAGAYLFLAAAVSLLASIRALERARPLMNRAAMTKAHYTILHYNELCVYLGSAWLLTGCVLAVLWMGMGAGSFLVQDLFIHATALGFIGSTIVCFGPMLLPGLLGRRGPASRLSFGPIVLLNAGVLARTAGDLYTLASGSLPAWTSLSGPMVIGAMLWFLLMVHGPGRKEAAGRLPPGKA